ncbi:hypothetical protein B0T25DRAFT_562120 [Lasiosphaeria hispida]|uniref:Dpy-30 domain-containing protein n=1 Tax=Lasiosphaeria hispida TaxID=260671 RepID=A0AAJ0HV26_9PEZI|nr:hypothetical protein B0T25DRAFT_562120 [Lasiosphaeria hispida]
MTVEAGQTQPAVETPFGALAIEENPDATPVNGTTSTTAPDPAEADTPADLISKDISMADAPPDQTAAPTSTPLPPATASAPGTAPIPPPAAPTSAPSNAPSPIPARVSTPTPMARNLSTNGEAGGTSSRAASAHPDPAATAGGGAGVSFSLPSEVPVHGAPLRQYLNTKVTGVLLQGMKVLAKEQPSDPLRVLGEFLLSRSREIEGTGP